MIGGSSVLNYMIYVRGNPEDYNRWSNVRKCKGWSYPEVLPFFKKIENIEQIDNGRRTTLKIRTVL